MKRFTLLFIAVLVSVVLFWLLVPNRVVNDIPDTTPAPTDSEFPTESAEVSPEETNSESDLLPVDEEVIPPGINGRVILREDNTGVKGATVIARWNEDGKWNEQETATSENGVFYFAVEGYFEYWLNVKHPTLVKEQRQLSAILTEEKPSEEIEIYVIEGGVIEGQVYDVETGQGIYGVEIGPSRRFGYLTDENGRYRISGLTAGAHRIFVGKAKGYLEYSDDGKEVTVTLGEITDSVDFALQSGVFGQISGKIIDDFGNPVADAKVEAFNYTKYMHSPLRGTETSTADGSFLLSDISIGEGYYLVAEKEEQISNEFGPLLITEEGVQDVVLTLQTKGGITGTAVDVNTRQPIKDTQFVVETVYKRMGMNSSGVYSAHLDENGNFEITDLPPGSCGLFLTPNPSSTGFPNAEVIVEVESGTWVENVVLTYDYERHLQWQAERRAAEEASANPPQPEETPQVGEVHGKVIDAETQTPVTDFELSMEWKEKYGFTMSDKTIHDSAGQFNIQGRRGEQLHINVTAKGYVPNNVTVEGGLGDQLAQEVTIEMHRGGIVEGKVTDTSGTPVAGAEIYIGTDSIIFNDISMEDRVAAVTNSEGIFLLDTLPPIETLVYVDHPEFAREEVAVTVSGNSPYPLNIVLRSGGVIEGTIRRGSQPLPNHNLMALNETGTNVSLDSMHTNEEGDYRIEHIPPGVYTLYTLVDDFNRAIYRDAEVATGKTTVVDFDFQDTSNTIEGTVLVDGKVPTQIYVNVDVTTDYGRENIRGRTLNTEQYRLGNLPLGVANVTIRATDAENTTATTEFKLEITGGAIRRDIELSAVE